MRERRKFLRRPEGASRSLETRQSSGLIIYRHVDYLVTYTHGTREMFCRSLYKRSFFSVKLSTVKDDDTEYRRKDSKTQLYSLVKYIYIYIHKNKRSDDVAIDIIIIQRIPLESNVLGFTAKGNRGGGSVNRAHERKGRRKRPALVGR